MLGLIGAGILVFVFVLASSSTTYVVEPGTRGIKVTLTSFCRKVSASRRRLSRQLCR